MAVHIGNDWDALLQGEWSKPYYQALRKKLIQEYRNYEVYPPADQIFRALELVSYADCRVVILGQDPYHNPHQANGLSFSVNRKEPLPPSLRNIYKELEEDLGIPPAKHGDLTAWARQGVLLLNAGLTVRRGQANSHKDLGWQILTDQIITLLGKRDHPLAFVLWGAFARSKRPLIQNPAHLILTSAHPSPFSADRGFFHSRPFSRINRFLVEDLGEEPICWRLD